MNKTIEYALFSRPLTRRTFYWLLFLCPWAALFIYCTNQPFHGDSIFALGWRIAATIGFHTVIGFVLWRHYRLNLKSEQARQQELLRQLA